MNKLHFNSLKNTTISVDVSTGDHNANYRIFAKLTGEYNDGVYLAEFESANFDMQIGWQQIETAPYDTWILLANKRGLSIGRRIKNHRLYGDCFTCLLGHEFRATHYAPLPDLPKE